MKLKAIKIFVVFLLWTGVYAGLVALANRYFRTHDMITPSLRFVLAAVLYVWLYFPFRWFCKQLDKLSASKK